ncbi:hypothetical protein UMM65_06330 [Aureibaculum sp. 2210JD6-5]|uniref:hypothetical protein n=1 Tax=Aureibaculum sp. 2210JD6-5 TaxID=3103957 RepID=UPI002AAD916F|nr:hypothetical protein [Aureibaculum sp. 2210JD6-5]MDY7394851.1 hypothetical protein [Aureibaculum sp. 2210JD6-5]
MGKLTSKQVHELANNFLALAQSIGDYRYKNYEVLTEEENKILRETHKRTLDYSDDLYTVSATLVIDNVKSSLAELDAITENIRMSYQSLEDVQKAIDIATNVITLGASIFSLNPQAISDAMGSLKDAVEDNPVA